MARLVTVSVVTLAIALFCGCQHRPQTAKQLGIAGLSQYGLAKMVFDNMSEVASLSATNPREAQELAKKNATLANFIWPQMPFLPLRMAAQSQQPLQGDLTALDPDKVRAVDKAYHARIAEESSEARYLRLKVFTDDEAWPKMQAAAEAIVHAGERLKQAQEIQRQTRNKLPLLCSQIGLLRAEADQIYSVELKFAFPVWDKDQKCYVEGHRATPSRLAKDTSAGNLERKADSIWQERYSVLIEEDAISR